MRKIKREKDKNFVWPQRGYFIAALIFSPITAAMFALRAFDALPLNLVSMPLAMVLSVAVMYYLGTVCFRLSEDGIVQYNFGIKTRRVDWKDIDQVGIGSTGTGPAIIMTLKGHKRYTPLKENGRVRDAEVFYELHYRGCILIKKAALSRTLVEKYYGELDYEWIPPDFK